MSEEKGLYEQGKFELIDPSKAGAVLPHIIQDFVSLEGEGGANAVGLSTLFVRLNKCNLTCNFCDTAFSIKGDPKHNIVRADTDEAVNYLLEKYSEEERQHIHACSITGGEPLLHLASFRKIVYGIKKAFPNIDQIIIETNGTVLYNYEACLEMLEFANTHKNIEITLSISPKLNGDVSFGKKFTNDDVYNLYKLVFMNYYHLLSGSVDVQCKFVHSDKLVEANEKLMNLIINRKLIEPRTKILIMPFTPNNYTSEAGAKIWKESKDAAAQYALKNFVRYSPRIHVDRGME